MIDMTRRISKIWVSAAVACLAIVAISLFLLSPLTPTAHGGSYKPGLNASFQAQITYLNKDGSTYTRTIKPDPSGQSLIVYDDSGRLLSTVPSLAVYDPTNNLEAKQVNVSLIIHPVFTGALGSWVMSTAACVEIFDSVAGSDGNHAMLAQTQSFGIQYSGGALKSDTDVMVTSSVINEAGLQSLYGGWQSGHSYFYTMALTAPVTFSPFFSDGTPNTPISQGTTSGFYWLFRYQQSGMISLSVNWLITPLS